MVKKRYIPPDLDIIFTHYTPQYLDDIVFTHEVGHFFWLRHPDGSGNNSHPCTITRYPSFTGAAPNPGTCGIWNNTYTSPENFMQPNLTGCQCMFTHHINCPAYPQYNSDCSQVSLMQKCMDTRGGVFSLPSSSPSLTPMNYDYNNQMPVCSINNQTHIAKLDFPSCSNTPVSINYILYRNCYYGWEQESPPGYFVNNQLDLSPWSLCTFYHRIYITVNYNTSQGIKSFIFTKDFNTTGGFSPQQLLQCNCNPTLPARKIENRDTPLRHVEYPSGIIFENLKPEDAIQIFDMFGRKIVQYSGIYNENLDLNYLPSAIYLIKIVHDGEQIIFKFNKQSL